MAEENNDRTVDREFPWPIFDETDIAAVVEVLRTGKWGSPDCDGAVARFEEEFARHHDVKHALATVNGSVALRMALLASGVRPGDEVIVPPYTFFATASIVVEANCVPIFADIADDTYCIDPDSIEEAITERTRVIIPVHFAGQAADMDRIMNIAGRRGITVIEDACHGHGGEYRGHKLGSIGLAGCFSFQSTKNLTSGEGGCVTTNSEEMRSLISSLRNCGRVAGHPWYHHAYLGCNYRMTQIQGALLLAQMRRLDQQARKRDANGLLLNELLSGIDGIRPLTRGHGETLHPYHIYVFRYDRTKFGGLHKREFADMLAREGVPCFIGYPEPLYRQPTFIEKNYFTYYKNDTPDYSKVCCPVCERACHEEAMWILPPAMLGEREDMERFAHAIRKVQDSIAGKRQL